jgi:hypothetical protein
MWMLKNHTNITINSNKGRSILAIGGLSKKLGLITLKVTKELNNKETFIQFIDKLLLALGEKMLQ